MGLSRLELRGERAGGPQILAIGETARCLFARTDVAVPAASSAPTEAVDAVGALEHESARRLFDRGRTIRVSLTVHASPGAKRRQLEPHRPVGGNEPMDDRNDRRSVRHRDLALDDDAADLPAPARDAVLELERNEQLVAARIDRPARPLVGCEAKASVARDDDGIERGQTEHAVGGTVDRNREQSVVATRAQACDRPHRVAAHSVG